MSLLRFLLLLSLVAWLGALIFFPFTAAAAFSALPSPHLAGLVVGSSLRTLHWMGLSCGLLFLASSTIYDFMALGRMRRFRPSHLLVLLMLALTAASQFRIIPRMQALRTSAGEITSLSANDPLRLQFDSLHLWSTRIEQAVLLLGLVVLYSLARRFSSSHP
jgi:hypothetical protein